MSTIFEPVRPTLDPLDLESVKAWVEHPYCSHHELSREVMRALVAEVERLRADLGTARTLFRPVGEPPVILRPADAADWRNCLPRGAILSDPDHVGLPDCKRHDVPAPERRTP